MARRWRPTRCRSAPAGSPISWRSRTTRARNDEHAAGDRSCGSPPFFHARGCWTRARVHVNRIEDGKKPAVAVRSERTHVGSWHAKPVEAIATVLTTDGVAGLSESE